MTFPPSAARRKAYAPIFCAVAAVCAPAWSQTVSLEPVVVTASRTEQRLQDALPATVILTRTDIELTQAVDLPALLRRVAGVEVTQNGGTGTLASSFIRGAEARHTLVLVDGVAINQHSFGTAALEHVPLDSVERIEIVRGNVSALYGSAALGGVIQVFTRQGSATPQASVSVQSGSLGTQQLGVTLTSGLGSATRLNLSVEALRSQGLNALNQVEVAGSNPDRDGYTRRAYALGVVQGIGRLAGATQDSTLALRLRDARGTTQYDSQFGPVSQADESTYVESGAALESQFKLAGGWSLNLAWTRSQDDLNAKITAYPYFVNSTSVGQSLGLEWQVASGQRVSGGVEHTRQQIASDTAYNKSARNQDSLRLGYQGDYALHQVQINLRQDRYNDFGNTSTYYAGYGYRITPRWRFNVSSSTGFNAPTFNDLYYPWGGNAALRPERVKSTEAGLQYAAAGQEFRAVLFHNRYRDLIGNDSFYNRVNIASSRNQGLELSYDQNLGHTRIRASATTQDPVDLDSGKRLSRRAAVLGQLSVSHFLGAWSTDASLRSTGSRPDGNFNLAGFALLDLGLQYVVTRELRATWRLDNALDRAYETVYGYRQPGRTFKFGLHWQPRG